MRGLSKIDIDNGFYNRRRDPRVGLPITLYLRRPIDETFASKEVRTENVSRQGARIICDVKLNVGTLLEISAFNGRFSAFAVVCYLGEKTENGWTIGINFIEKTGSWVVI